MGFGCSSISGRVLVLHHHRVGKIRVKIVSSKCRESFFDEDVESSVYFWSRQTFEIVVPSLSSWLAFAVSHSFIPVGIVICNSGVLQCSVPRFLWIPAWLFEEISGRYHNGFRYFCGWIFRYLMLHRFRLTWRNDKLGSLDWIRLIIRLVGE
jgi:hypothetical protein